jgi:acetyl-CoA C-acetyltransferase
MGWRAMKSFSACTGSAALAMRPRSEGVSTVPAVCRIGADRRLLPGESAAQVLADTKPLGIPQSKLNVCGGGVALGHPIGASGARVLVTLVHQLHRTGGKRGICSLCLGGGNAVSMMVEVG